MRNFPCSSRNNFVFERKVDTIIGHLSRRSDDGDTAVNSLDSLVG